MNLRRKRPRRNYEFRVSGRPRYTQESDDLLREHYPKGTCLEWLGKQMKRTPKQLRDRANRLGMKRPKATILSDDQIKDLRVMWEDGTPREEIAETFGITVEQARKQASIQGLRRPQWYIEQIRFEAAQKVENRVVEHGLPAPLLPEDLISRMYAGRRYEDVRLRS